MYNLEPTTLVRIDLTLIILEYVNGLRGSAICLVNLIQFRLSYMQLLHAGYPEPHLYWFKDGQPLHASDRILKTEKKDFNALEVLGVMKEDAGQYSAFITNSAGSAYTSARLVVKGTFGTNDCHCIGDALCLIGLSLRLEHEEVKVFKEINWRINQNSLWQGTPPLCDLILFSFPAVLYLSAVMTSTAS